MFYPQVADHCLVEVTAPVPVPMAMTVQREVWHFRSAEWDRLNALLGEADWSFLRELDSSEGAKRMTRTVVEAAKLCIKRKLLVERKSTHPWLNDRVLRAVDAKRKAEGTSEEKEKAVECSASVLREYNAWCKRVREELNGMQSGSKTWWTKQKQLQQHRQQLCSIPALKDEAGDWIQQPEGRANLLAEAFGAKYHLPAAQRNECSEVMPVQVDWDIDRAAVLSVERAGKALGALREDSATGPDLFTDTGPQILRCSSGNAHILAGTCNTAGRSVAKLLGRPLGCSDLQEKECV